MVFNMINESDISHLPQLKWGIVHEKDGVKSFMSDIASQHEGGLVGFQRCGLYVKADYPYLAGSPDGLFMCKCCGPATVEIKCPYSVRNENIMERSLQASRLFGRPQWYPTIKADTQVPHTGAGTDVGVRC